MPRRSLLAAFVVAAVMLAVNVWFLDTFYGVLASVGTTRGCFRIWGRS